MGIPDKLAVHGTGRDQHRQLLDFLGQGGFVSQVVDQVVGAPTHLGAIDHDRAWTGRDHATTAGGLRVEGGAQWLGNPVSGHYRCTWHILLLLSRTSQCRRCRLSSQAAPPEFSICAPTPLDHGGSWPRRIEQTNAIVPQYPQRYCSPAST